MTNVVRTKYAALVAALVIGVSDLYAQECAPVNPCCIPAEPCCIDTCAVNDCCCGTFWVRGDLLYWRACEDGFGCDFGTTSITTNAVDGQIITDINESDRDVDFHWDLGFRVGVGYSRTWDVGVYWTHINERGRGHHGGNHAKWRLKFNEVDAILGYEVDFSPCFSVTPFIGARFAFIHQKFSTYLESTILIEATDSSSVAISTKRDTEHFWGGGPLIGFEGEFDLWCGFRLYGILAGDVLYGNFKSKFRDSDIFTAAVNNCDSSARSCACLTGIDWALGLRYDICWVGLQLGWEHHIFFDFNHIGCTGDLNLYGLNASIILSY